MSVKDGGLTPRQKVPATAGPSTSAEIEEDTHEGEGIAISDQEVLELGEELEDLEVGEEADEVVEEEELNEPETLPDTDSSQLPSGKSLFVLDPFIPNKVGAPQHLSNVRKVLTSRCPSRMSFLLSRLPISRGSELNVSMP